MEPAYKYCSEQTGNRPFNRMRQRMKEHVTGSGMQTMFTDIEKNLLLQINELQVRTFYFHCTV